MKKLFLLITLFALIGTSMAYAEPVKVAVYVTGGSDAGISKILGDQLVSAFTKSGRYIAVERTGSFLAELRKEQNYQQTGAVDDREISRLGIQFGVQMVCVAEINEAFGKSYVSSRLIDAESVEIVNTASQSSELNSMEELLRVAQDLAKVLTGKTEKEKVKEEIAEQKAAEKRRQEEAAKEQVKEIERQKKIAEAERRGYIVVDNFLVSYPPAHNIDWRTAARMAESKGYGWTLPTLGQAQRISTYVENELGGGFIEAVQNHFDWYYWTSDKCKNTYYGDNHTACKWGSTLCWDRTHKCSAVFVKAKH
ncbi:MAG: hypothetical protein NC324_09075 [Bacteroides sp.]|nr:hypothetical protein [Bacteroides sp.]